MYGLLTKKWDRDFVRSHLVTSGSFAAKLQGMISLSYHTLFEYTNLSEIFSRGTFFSLIKVILRF